MTDIQRAGPPTPRGDDGWVKWGGGERPVPAETLVDVRLSGGSTMTSMEAGMLNWRAPPLGLIAAYRLSDPDSVDHAGDAIPYFTGRGAGQGAFSGFSPVTHEVRDPDEIAGTAIVRSGAAAPGYERLFAVLMRAQAQAADGKGRERHAQGRPFDRQPILEIGRTEGIGAGFDLGQAMKKIQEAAGMTARGQRDEAVAELLGAIVYAAAAVLLIEERRSSI